MAAVLFKPGFIAHLSSVVTLPFTQFMPNRKVKIECGVGTSFHCFFFFKVAILVCELCRFLPAQISFCSFSLCIYQSGSKRIMARGGALRSASSTGISRSALGVIASCAEKLPL